MSGRIVHFEVPFDDGDRARAFYGDLFGWKLQHMPDMQYTLVMTGPVSEQGVSSEPGYINGGMMQREAPAAPCARHRRRRHRRHPRSGGRAGRLDGRPEAARRRWGSRPTSPTRRATSWAVGVGASACWELARAGAGDAHRRRHVVGGEGGHGEGVEDLVKAEPARRGIRALDAVDDGAERVEQPAHGDQRDDGRPAVLEQGRGRRPRTQPSAT